MDFQAITDPFASFFLSDGFFLQKFLYKYTNWIRKKYSNLLIIYCFIFIMYSNTGDVENTTCSLIIEGSRSLKLSSLPFISSLAYTVHTKKKHFVTFFFVCSSHYEHCAKNVVKLRDSYVDINVIDSMP